jgi:hypothetical protein
LRRVAEKRADFQAADPWLAPDHVRLGARTARLDIPGYPMCFSITPNVLELTYSVSASDTQLDNDGPPPPTRTGSEPARRGESAS